MPSFPFLALPLELRTEIYAYVFTAPKGRIELINTSPRGSDPHYAILPLSSGGCAIRLSFLRTNKQIYTEAKHLLWAYNTLHLSSLLVPEREGILPPLSPQITHHVGSVSLDIDTTFHKTLSSTLLFQHNLTTLTTWIRSGRLNSITLYLSAISGRGNFTTRQFDKILQRRIDPAHSLTYNDYLTALRLGTEPGPLSTISRKFIIDTGPSMPVEPTFRPRPLAGNPMPLLREIAHAWGGKLEVNGILAFQDGREVEDVFLVQDEDEEGKEKKYFFREDVELWFLSLLLEEDKGLYMPKHLMGLERSARWERREFCKRYEGRMRELRGVHGIRRIEEEEEEEEEEVEQAQG